MDRSAFKHEGQTIVKHRKSKATSQQRGLEKQGQQWSRAEQHQVISERSTEGLQHPYDYEVNPWECTQSYDGHQKDGFIGRASHTWYFFQHI